jgi:hypothetical protein
MRGYSIGRGAQIRTEDPLLPKQVRYQAAPRPDSHHYRISGFQLKMQADVRRNVARLRILGPQIQYEGVGSLNFDYSQNMKNSCANPPLLGHRTRGVSTGLHGLEAVSTGLSVPYLGYKNSDQFRANRGGDVGDLVVRALRFELSPCSRSRTRVFS